MESMDTASTATAISGAVAALAASCFKARTQRHRAREEARADHVRNLGPGSRLLDLGEGGILIEICRNPPTDQGNHADGT